MTPSRRALSGHDDQGSDEQHYVTACFTSGEVEGWAVERWSCGDRRWSDDEATFDDEGGGCENIQA